MKIDTLLGKTITAIEGMAKGSDTVTFACADGTCYQMHHSQSCCESVEVEDVCGDVADLVGSPIVRAEESTSNEKLEGSEEDQGDSFTWTFYRIATGKGLVVLRWFGSSNGCYGEEVDFDEA